MTVVKVTSLKFSLLLINELIYAQSCFLGQATDMQLPVRHLGLCTSSVVKNAKTEHSVEPLELMVAYLFDDLN
jgi:hypothetical protein